MWQVLKNIIYRGDRMRMKVAIFGRKTMVNHTNKVLNSYKDMEFNFFPYSTMEEIRLLIDKAYLCDIYLFTEQLPYLFIKKKLIRKKLPCIHVSFDEYMLLTALHQLQTEKTQAHKRFSIDACDDRPVKNVLSEFSISENEVHILKMDETMFLNYHQVTNYHQRLWEQGKIDFVLTSLEEVKHTLKQKNIPVSCMPIPNVNLAAAIDEARKIGQLYNYQKNTVQVVIGYLELKGVNQPGKEACYTLHQLIADFVQQTNATVVTNHNKQLVIFGTNPVLEQIKQYYRDFPLLHIIERQLEAPVAMGFGVALNANEAEKNARLALQSAQATNDSKCYLVNQCQDIIVPIGVPKTFDTSKLYHALIHEARLNNDLSYNFIQFITKRNNEPFSSHDFALHYKVTKRSAERTINKLLSGKVIKIAGEEKPYVRGRPRKLFNLNL